jgi:hypothetical protein
MYIRKLSNEYYDRRQTVSEPKNSYQWIKEWCCKAPESKKAAISVRVMESIINASAQHSAIILINKFTPEEEEKIQQDRNRHPRCHSSFTNSIIML